MNCAINEDAVRRDVKNKYVYRDPNAKEMWKNTKNDITGQQEITDWKCEKIKSKP